jgi:hypothetical protein
MSIVTCIVMATVSVPSAEVECRLDLLVPTCGQSMVCFNTCYISFIWRLWKVAVLTATRYR